MNKLYKNRKKYHGQMTLEAYQAQKKLALAVVDICAQLDKNGFLIEEIEYLLHQIPSQINMALIFNYDNGKPKWREVKKSLKTWKHADEIK